MGLFDKTTNTTGSNITQNTATATATPYKAVVKPLNTLVNKVNKAVAQPVNADLTQGMSLLRNLATQPNQQLEQGNSYLSGLLANGGMSQGMQDVASYLRPMASGPINMSPYAGQVAGLASQNATTGALAQASASGRYGSNAATGGAVQASMDAQMPYLSQEWNAANQRQQQAQSLLANLYQGAQGSALNGMQMLPGLDQMKYAGATALMQGGQAMDNSIWDRFKNATSIYGIAGQQGGTKTSSGTSIDNRTGTQNTPSSTLQDVAGIGGIVGSLWTPGKGIVKDIGSWL
jgi:hypothetical protein